jgi:Mrp family chromosome partitioning ATPase
MELEFVWKAVRRYWPVVVACTLMSVAAATLLSPSAAIRYQSSALVLITSGEGGSAGDRYVSSELVILRSPPIAERAMELAGAPMSALAGSDAVTFAQIPGTDVVRIIASSTAPAEAQAIANGYLDAYLEGKRALGVADQDVDAASLQERVSEIEGQLDDIEQRVEEELAPYVEAAPASNEVQGTISIPTIQDVAPALSVEREVLIDQYRTALSQLSELQFAAPESSVVDRQVIQRAELPSQALATSSNMLEIAVVLGGLLLGVALATVLARASRYVLDADEVESILEAPIAAVVPKRRSLTSRSLDQLAQLPVDVSTPINELCVQVESAGASAPGWSVVVTGTRRHIGTTTVAAAMANRFAELGSRVVLVDLDTEDPALSAHFDVDRGGLAALAAAGERDWEDIMFVPTGSPMLSIIGGWAGPGRSRPSRPELEAALRSLARHADLVVVDAGPLLASSSAAILAQSSDAVVLTVPIARQPRASLEQVARQLDVGDRALFPVAVPNPRRARRSPPRSTTSKERQHPEDSGSLENAHFEVRAPEISRWS